MLKGTTLGGLGGLGVYWALCSFVMWNSHFLVELGNWNSDSRFAWLLGAVIFGGIGGIVGAAADAISGRN